MQKDTSRPFVPSILDDFGHVMALFGVRRAQGIMSMSSEIEKFASRWQSLKPKIGEHFSMEDAKRTGFFKAERVGKGPL